ncbi:2Fe-2S iron-sulfur cluster binding domain-containing protein [Nocardia sp. BMG111209]|uniref:2Fe-2S iron-sulfur cluster-binding protein n=1 Tax=Nocardia sp. BMG111209 TaxID=1160137 RepID=UPI000372E147|nr:2Fe-2S iron-sulfur cluster binding domain-containing protein [Nocardia sp. BMG111209]
MNPQPVTAEIPAATGRRVTVVLGKKRVTIEHRPGETVLDCARRAGLSPPAQCELGGCGTCMARLTEGHVTMAVNNVLGADDLAEGWILTCQAVPDGPATRVRYE